MEDQLSGVVDAPPEERGCRFRRRETHGRQSWTTGRPVQRRRRRERRDSSGEPRRAAPKPRFRLSLATDRQESSFSRPSSPSWLSSLGNGTGGLGRPCSRRRTTPTSEPTSRRSRQRFPGYVRRVPCGTFRRSKPATCWSRSSTTTTAPSSSRREANVAAAQAAIESIEQQKLLQATIVKQAEADIEASEADLTRYHLEAVRQQALLATGLAGTPQLTEQAVDNEKRAEAALALNRAKLEQQRQQLNVLDSQAAQADRDAQTRGRRRAISAAINLGYTRIISPVDGMVSERLVRPGQYLSVGSQVISIVPLPNVWIVANYKETQMTRIRVGQPAHATVDAFPGVVLRGHVDSWSPASGAQFSLLPPDNATGNFTKVVQRIPVKIVLDPDPALGDLLRPGCRSSPP